MDKHLLTKGIKESIPFPKKAFFNNFSLARIEERRVKIQNFLNRLSELINLIEYPEACEFLEVEGYTKTLLSSLEFEIQESGTLSPLHRPAPSEDLDTSTLVLSERKETAKVRDFLAKLNNEPLMIAKTVDEFETYYFENSLSLLKDEIKTFLWGDDRLKGLLYFCGDTHKYIGSNSCMQFLVKLIKFEYNSVEAEKFLEVFSMTDPTMIRQMNLGFYIKQSTSLDNVGLLSAFYYLQKNTHSVGEPKEILGDEKSIEEYNKWLQNKLSGGNSDIFLTEIGYLFKLSVRKASSKGNMAESKGTTEDNEDEKEDVTGMMAKSVEELKIGKSLLDSSREASMPYAKNLLSQLDGYASWDLIDSFAEDTIRIYSRGKKDLRFTLELATDDIEKVSKHFFDLEKRAKWDSMKWSVIKKENDHQDIVQFLFPFPLGKTRFIEYIIFRNLEYIEGGESIIMTERSLLLPQSEVQDIRRVHVNSCIRKINVKINTDGQQYVECQVLLTSEEGYENTAEYNKYIRKEIESEIMAMNALLKSG